MKSIFIIGPDHSISAQLLSTLTNSNINAIICDETITEFQLRTNTPKAIILDSRTKWRDSRSLFHWCENLNIPLLFLTENASMTDHLNSLYKGKCQVLTLPFTDTSLKVALCSLLDEGSVNISTKKNELKTTLDKSNIPLTAQESALLNVLMETPDQPLSREHLLRKAWGYQSIGDTRTVDVHIQRLRKKLGMRLIETVYRCGYKLCLN